MTAAAEARTVETQPSPTENPLGYLKSLLEARPYIFLDDGKNCVYMFDKRQIGKVDNEASRNSPTHQG